MIIGCGNLLQFPMVCTLAEIPYGLVRTMLACTGGGSGKPLLPRRIGILSVPVSATSSLEANSSGIQRSSQNEK